MLAFVLVVLLAALAAAAAASPVERASADWHTIEWDSREFTAFEGDFVVPAVPTGARRGMPYVWPGLQGESGALQAVLDGRSGAWSLGNGFFGASPRPLGDRFDVRPGDSVHFAFARPSPSSPWACTLSGPRSTAATVAVPGAAMTRAVLAVDLTNVPHDFSVTYENLVITAASAPAAQWCSKTLSRGYEAGYTLTNITAAGTTCRISKVILPSTA